MRSRKSEKGAKKEKNGLEKKHFLSHLRRVVERELSGCIIYKVEKKVFISAEKQDFCESIKKREVREKKKKGHFKGWILMSLAQFSASGKREEATGLFSRGLCPQNERWSSPQYSVMHSAS